MSFAGDTGLSPGRSEQKSRKDGEKCGKASHWMRRLRMIEQQGIWIEDDSGSGKSTIGCFGSLRDEEGKTGWRSLEKVDQVDLGF